MEADRAASKRRNLLLILVPILIMVAAFTFLVLWAVLHGGTKKAIQGEGGSLEIECTVDKPVAFEFDGEEHEARLVEVVGSSAIVAFSSDSPQEVTLTVGLPTEGDLDSDAIPEVSATLVELSPGKARIDVVPIERLAWDESGFTTSGGFKVYKHEDNSADLDFSVVPQGDSYLLFYISEDSKLNWERYDSSGALITVPELEVSVLDLGPGIDKATSVDGALAGDDIAVATTTAAGVCVRTYDSDLFNMGQSLYIGGAMNHPAMVTGGEHTYIATSGQFDPPRIGEGNERIIVTEADLSGSPAILGQKPVTTTQDSEHDMCCDAAWDEETGTLFVLYKRLIKNDQNIEMRLVAVDPETLAPVWDSLVGAAAARGTRPSGSVAASSGTATVIWRCDRAPDGGQQLHVSTATATTGEVTRIWDGKVSQASPPTPRAVIENYPYELVSSGSMLAFAYYGPAVKEGPGSSDRARFALWPWEGSGWAASGIILDGGKPDLADPLIDLNSFNQVPVKAICGAPVALKGKVVNRGGMRAANVGVIASVDGQQIGQVSLGGIEGASSADFSMIWQVPEDFTAEEAEVTFALTTTSEQYTTGNDTTTRAFLVRQKGLVIGSVIDASSDVNHLTNLYPAIANARVTIGDQTVLTDIAGLFTLDGLEFGTYPVVVEREGYNRLESDVTVSRTRPLGLISAELDNHGVIRLRVVDEAGNPLEGVAVYLHDYAQKATTPASGELAWDISARTYTFSFTKQGYHAVGLQEVEVVMGEERTETITMKEAKTGLLGGKVVNKHGEPISGATVTIKDEGGEVVAQAEVKADGTFEAVELPAKPPKVYEITASGNGITITESVKLFGGDNLFHTLWLVPDRGERRVRSATEGYTSWMIKASWPGIGDVSGADIYVWYGNYAICVGAEYWGGTKELAAIDVTVWGGAYETHVTKSEVDFSGWFEPEEGSIFDLTEYADIPEVLAEEHSGDLLDIAGALVDGFTGDEKDDEYIVTGQGKEILTWKEAKSDFAPQLGFDSSDPLTSMWNVVDAVPRSFAIPVVIGGSSEEQTAVRVDQVDVVRLGTGDSIGLSGPENEWYSYQGPEGSDNYNGKTYEVTQEDIPFDDVAVYVWVTVQKYSHGTPSGTCFDQREQQLIIFIPHSQSLAGYNASGDLYCNPSLVAR